MRSKKILAPLTLVVALGVALALAASARPEPREITLVARDMAYYLPGDPTPNPTLELVAGERVALTLLNEEPGSVHDVYAAGLDLETRPLRAGERVREVFRAPERPGEHDYVCTFHDRMMRGRIVVR